MKTTIFLAVPCVLLFTFLATGCNRQKTHDEHNQKQSETPGHEHEGHSHAKGAHGGEVYIVGNDVANVELKHDTDQVTVWLSDHDGHGVDGGPSIMLQLFEDSKFADYTLPQTETPGMYQLTDKKLCDRLKEHKDLKARLHVTLQGKKETATIEHHAH